MRGALLAASIAISPLAASATTWDFVVTSNDGDYTPDIQLVDSDITGQPESLRMSYATIPLPLVSDDPNFFADISGLNIRFRDDFEELYLTTNADLTGSGLYRSDGFCGMAVPQCDITGHWVDPPSSDVPEPPTWSLFGLWGIGVVAARKILR